MGTLRTHLVRSLRFGDVLCTLPSSRNVSTSRVEPAVTRSVHALNTVAVPASRHHLKGSVHPAATQGHSVGHDQVALAG